MADKNIFSSMERFINRPWEEGAPFDPFITSDRQEFFCYVPSPLLPGSRPARYGKEPLSRFDQISALLRRHKHFCASKPKAAGGRIWMFSDFSRGTVVLRDRRGAQVNKGRMKPHWYRCMTDLWERRVRLRP